MQRSLKYVFEKYKPKNKEVVDLNKFTKKKIRITISELMTMLNEYGVQCVFKDRNSMFDTICWEIEQIFGDDNAKKDIIEFIEKMKDQQ